MGHTTVKVLHLNKCYVCTLCKLYIECVYIIIHTRRDTQTETGRQKEREGRESA